MITKPMPWLCFIGDFKLTLKEIDQLRESYEHWNRMYSKSGDMNHLVRAKDFLNAYMKAVNESNISGAQIRALEERYADTERHALDYTKFEKTKQASQPTQQRVCDYLTDLNDWAPISEIAEELSLSVSCIRTALNDLIRKEKVEKRQNLQHHHKRAEYRVKIQ